MVGYLKARRSLTREIKKAEKESMRLTKDENLEILNLAIELNCSTKIPRKRQFARLLTVC